MKFTALGVPATKGSTKSFAIKRGGVYTGRTVTTTDNPRGKSWQGVVAEAAHAAGVTPLEGPVALGMEFVFQRPKSHYGTGRNAAIVKASADRAPVGKNLGDLSKLWRCAEDALIGIAFRDDSQVVEVLVPTRKRWALAGEPSGVTITLARALVGETLPVDLDAPLPLGKLGRSMLEAGVNAKGLVLPKDADEAPRFEQ